jgi:hypothetical protein
LDAVAARVEAELPAAVLLVAANGPPQWAFGACFQS